MNEISVNRVFSFGEFTLDLDRASLRRGAAEVRLRPRTYDVLAYLVRNAGRVVSKQELFDAVWGEVAVSDDSLVQCLVEIRKALDGSHDYVKTVRSRGYLFDTEVRHPHLPEPSAAATPIREAGGQGRFWRIAIVSLLPVVLIGTGAWLLGNRSRPATLAVLPLIHTQGAAASERAEGLHEEIIGALGQIDPPRLRVLSRRSTMAYAGTRKSSMQIGRELAADFLVEGLIHEGDARMRLTFTVVRTRDQVQIWTGTFDHDRSTFPYLQTELGRAIAQQVHLKLSAAQEQALVRRQARHPEAYGLYLRGRALWGRTNKAAIYAAVDAFQQATALDPDYALAHAGLAQAYSILPLTSDVPPLDVAPRARAAAAQAVRADPLLAEAHAAAGWQEFWFGWDWAAAEVSLRRAIALDPNYADARRWLGHVLSNAGRHSESLAEMALARELDPFSPVMRVVSAQAAYQARDFRGAERHARDVIAMDPNLWAGHINLAQALAAQHRFEEALAATAQATRLDGNAKGLTLRGYILGRMGRSAEAQTVLRDVLAPAGGGFVPPSAIALVYAGLGEADDVFAWLEKAYAARDVNLVFLPVDPKLDPFRGDPRFRSLLDRCGFLRRP